MADRNFPRILDIHCPAMVDGPGLRTVLTLAGCSLRCIWCQNPLSRGFDSGENGLSPESLAERILRDRIWWEDRADSGPGGVTISGGEPLEHGPYLLELCGKLAGLGVHVSIQTSLGTACRELPELARRISHWQVDLKHADPEKYLMYTGVTGEILLGNLKILRENGAKIFPRLVLVPGLTDDASHLERLAGFCENQGFSDVEFLDYNPPPTAGGILPVKALGPSEKAAVISIFRTALRQKTSPPRGAC